MCRRAAVLVALAACAPAARPAPPAPPAPPPAEEPGPITSPRALPAPAPRPQPRDPLVRDALPLGPRTLRGSPYADRLDELAHKRSELWDPCVRDVIADRPAELREPLGDALTMAMTTCDRATGTIVFEPPRSGRAYATGSHVGLAGTIAPATVALVLRVVVRGPAPERLTILAGGVRWTSGPLDVTHDPTWQRELAVIPYTRSVARVVHRMLATDGAVLRFESATGMEDVLVTEELASDLRAMLDALEPL